MNADKRRFSTDKFNLRLKKEGGTADERKFSTDKFNLR